ncbi:hypothetical protein [Bradyrhizobium prioriisuperbiae]|uniref:hypothetical protein n=1 Tax=Bradyrhizobium prioriisuperbiae TaxID=2854389 RepID=UPI0028ED26E7|nr:hypothetical protein [Bradyrhizobium prioritasuperba]
MLKKSLLTMSLLLPLAAISATAQAGSTITDKSYWPNEARPIAYDAVPQVDPNSAFASTVTAPRSTAVPRTDEVGNGPRYHGGPKSQ